MTVVNFVLYFDVELAMYREECFARERVRRGRLGAVRALVP